MSKAKDLINELLVETFNRILTIEGEALKKEGVKLSMSEVHVLEAVEKLPEPSMTAISQKLGITPGSLSVAINTLFQKGYVRRYTDNYDRRKVLVALEDKSKTVLDIHQKFHQHMIDSVFSDLKLGEDEILIQSLKNVSDYFKLYQIE